MCVMWALHIDALPPPPSAPQEPSKLESGGFYLDRTAQPKHLALTGTAYGRAPVDELWSALEGMCAGKVRQAQ